MSQQDCLDFLRAMRESDPNKWFRIKEVQEALREKGLGNGTIKKVGSHLYKLAVCGDLDVRGIGIWEHYKEFRYSKEII